MQHLSKWRAIIAVWWVVLLSGLYSVSVRLEEPSNPADVNAPSLASSTAEQLRSAVHPTPARASTHTSASSHRPQERGRVPHGATAASAKQSPFRLATHTSSDSSPFRFAAAPGSNVAGQTGGHIHNGQDNPRVEHRMARLPESSEASGEDDLLFGNPYHQDGKFKGSAPGTQGTNGANTQAPATQKPQYAPPVRYPVTPSQKQRQTQATTPTTVPRVQVESTPQTTLPNRPAARRILAPPTMAPEATKPIGAGVHRNANQQPSVNTPQAPRNVNSPPVNNRSNNNYGRNNTLPTRNTSVNTPGSGTVPDSSLQRPSSNDLDDLLQNNPYNDEANGDEVGGAIDAAADDTNTFNSDTRQTIQQVLPPREQQFSPSDSRPGATSPGATSPSELVPAMRNEPNQSAQQPFNDLDANQPNAPFAAPATPATETKAADDGDSLFGDLYGDGEDDPASDDELEEGDNDSDASEGEDDEYVDPHFELYSKNLYPSAKQCAQCHEQIYKEWAVSSHAYASVSPMFHKFEQKINGLAQGTVGYFCLRCHAPVATAMNIERDASLLEQIPAAYEGVTCIACHRVNERYTRANGERLIEPGPIENPVYGATDGSGLEEVIANKDHYKVKLSPDETGPGQNIHNSAIFFDQLNKSEFCVSCHQVAVFPGIKLEVVWEQYRASPACKEGISCQDCHMGKVPGKALGYATGPGAVVGGKPVNPNRKHANHMFFGPGYSVAHPGIFPFNMKTDEYDWKPSDWLQFDYRSQWGSEKFEDAVDNGEIQVNFPEVWSDADDRRDAWDIVQENMDTMAMEKRVRSQLMENSSHIDGPFFANKPKRGKSLRFHYDVSNLNSGHNAPSGSLGAQPQIWVNAALINPRGERVWESGYTDGIGDVADTLSLEVAAGRCKPDLQLVNFQSKFLFTHVKGTDREWFLPVNFDLDQLPFLRPSGFPITTLNHPPFIRMEQRSLPPLSTRKAKYKVPAKAMKIPGKYRLSVRMRSRSHPIYFVRFCEGTPDMERRINEGMLDFHQDSVEFIVR